MNIFFLDTDPTQAAAMLCDKHLSKMQLETAQMLSTAVHELGVPHLASGQLYKPTHKHHPSSVWARASWANVLWLHNYVLGMGLEWLTRGHKQHASSFVSLNAIYALDSARQSVELCDELTAVPLCMPEQHWAGLPKHVPMAEAVAPYRSYYSRDKAYMAKWPEGRKPGWYTSN